MSQQRRWWPRRRFLLGLGALYLLGFAAINVAGARQSDASADCILVPGARVEADGTPGASLESRLLTAADLYRQGRAAHIVCTGGRGESGAIEAEGAKTFLLAQGVPADAVVLEDMSHTTWENFVFARQEMQRRGWSSCLVTSDPFHMPRCLAMADELGLQAYSAPSFRGPGWRPGGMLFYTSREMAAWAKYLGERAGR